MAVSAGSGNSFRARGGDDAERALGADEQGFHVVAGVVLAQALQARQHPAVGQHHFEAQHQVAHHAVAQDRRAAGIGREVAADLRGALRSQAQGEQALGIARGALRLGEGAAGLDDHGIVGGVDLRARDSGAAQRQHDLRAASSGVAPPQ